MNKTYKGSLVTIEGIDGSGKSSLCKAIAEKLAQQDRAHLLTKEPGGSELGQHLRTLLHTRTQPICPEAEFLLFAADRAQHVQTVIAPALQAGKIVISDRMSDSSLAYQGYGRGLDCSMIEQVNHWVMGEYTPTVTIYIKVPIDIAFERIIKTRATLTAFEQEQRIFWERVSNGFDAIFAKRNNVIILDGTLPEPVLCAAAFDRLHEWIL